MPHVRRDVWKLPPGDKTLEWYGKAVNALLKRPLSQPNSWRYLAAMHGANEQAWRDAGYLDDGSSFPDPRPTSPAWDQCQHQSWFFLPWHRGYLAAFEAIVRDVIAKMPGAPQDWALPYWNYNDTSNQRRLEMPPAFANPTLPDGTPNGLFVERRFGQADGEIVLDDDRIDLRPSMLSGRFTGVETGSSSGFGGPSTPFNHGGGTGGILEGEPHNQVHGMVGGAVRDAAGNIIMGLMSRPNTAALDPIFWLHHANIDRLWEVWLERGDGQNKNPTDDLWINGPIDIKFTMPNIDGSSFRFSPTNMLDTTSPRLDYTYESTADPFPGQSRVRSRPLVFSLGPNAPTFAARMRAMPQKTELVGSYTTPLRIGPTPVSANVPLDKPTHRKTLDSLRSFSVQANREPDRVFVNIENIRGRNDAAAFYVYVNLPDNADPKAFPDHRARPITLFGVEEASKADGKHGGNGLTEVVEITDVVDRLHAKGAIGEDQIKVSLVPANDIQLQDDISVGAISIYRQEQ